MNKKKIKEQELKPNLISYDKLETKDHLIKRDGKIPDSIIEEKIHKYKTGKDCKSHVCLTGDRGYPHPKNRSPTEIVVHQTDGFIPLWAQNQKLRWRFNETSMLYFADPFAAKEYFDWLLGYAVNLWGYAAPVSFTYDEDLYDFEIVMQEHDNCSNGGCVLASAFFPDGGTNELYLYPVLLEQTDEEIIETMVHELGHVFGLRHFFANTHETDWPSHIFGEHSEYSIMNYGEKSELTDADLMDLEALYQGAWSGELTQINGTRIKLFKPYSSY